MTESRCKTCRYVEFTGFDSLNPDLLPSFKHLLSACDSCVAAQSTTLALLRLGSIDRKNRDIYRIIARCVWSARLDERWERKPGIMEQMSIERLLLMLMAQFFGFITAGGVLWLSISVINRLTIA